MTSSRNSASESSPDPAWLPPAFLPMPPAPGFGYAPPRPRSSGLRTAVGVLLILASGFIGCGWLMFAGLVLGLQGEAGVGGLGWFGVVLGVAGLIIGLSGAGAIGLTATARLPMSDHWVRVWTWLSCVFGGLVAAMVTALVIWFHVANH